MASATDFLLAVHDSLLEFGLFRYILPFLLTLFIIYGVLRNVNLFGEEGEGRRIDAGIAVTLAALITVSNPFKTGVFAAFLSTYFAYVAIMLIVLLFGLLLAGMITHKPVSEYFKGKAAWVPVVIGFLIAGFLAASSGATQILPGEVRSSELAVFFNPSFLGFLAVVAGFLFLIYWAMWKSGSGD